MQKNGENQSFIVDIIWSMSNTDRMQPIDDSTEGDQEAVNQLFRRIAARGRRIRNKQKDLNREVIVSDPVQGTPMSEKGHSGSDDQYDPIVEILRLAYRRGLVIRREQNRNTAP